MITTNSIVKLSTEKQKLIVFVLFFSVFLSQKLFSQNNFNYSLKSLTSYQMNFAFQYGGEARISPKINLLRKHYLSNFSPYYGVEVGMMPLFVTASHCFSVILGAERGIFSTETSVSHFTFSLPKETINQNLVNWKFGVQIKKVKLKFGVSYIFSEKNASEEKSSLLKIGKINHNIIWCAELQFRIL